MYTKGLQNKEDELQWLIIRLEPLVLTDKAEGKSILLTVERDLQGGVKTSAQSIAAGEAEAVTSALLLEAYCLSHYPVKQVSFFEIDRGRFNDIMVCKEHCGVPRLSTLCPQYRGDHLTRTIN